MKKILLSLVFFLAAMPTRSLAQWPYAQNAFFESVTGKVTVADKGGMIRKVEKGLAVFSGETVFVAKDSYATLRFFDGSTVELKPSTQFMIASLKHPDNRQKEI